MMGGGRVIRRSPYESFGMPQHKLLPRDIPVGGGKMHGASMDPMGGFQTPQTHGFQSPGWQERGFASQDAARSVGKQFGLVKQPNGTWGKPTMDWFQNQISAMGWGPNQTADTPIGIGGARWMAGPSGLQFTGQASDSPFGHMPVGQAYDSAQQTPYDPQGGGRIRRRGGTVGGYLQ